MHTPLLVRFCCTARRSRDADSLRRPASEGDLDVRSESGSVRGVSPMAARSVSASDKPHHVDDAGEKPEVGIDADHKPKKLGDIIKDKKAVNDRVSKAAADLKSLIEAAQALKGQVSDLSDFREMDVDDLLSTANQMVTDAESLAKQGRLVKANAWANTL